jgi:uncharacterized protein YxjI
MISREIFLIASIRLKPEGKKLQRNQKRGFGKGDSYGVEIEPRRDAGLILKIVAVLDQMAHD